MASSSSKPASESITSEPNNLAPQAHRFPREKLTALARLKSFGGSFVNHRNPSPPILFPPPSWDLSDELLGKSVPNVALAESNFEDPVVERPEAVPFAKRLRILIESLPIPGTSSFTAQSTSNDSQTLGDEGKTGSPVPPDMDEGLVRMLASEEIMNGGHSKTSNNQANDRPGIWNILASLKKGGTKEGSPRPGAVEEEEGGVMMYAPLEPNPDSQLELASSETVFEHTHEHSHGSTSRRNAKNQHDIGEKHVWVPSTTHLSLLTTWWGYRLYLPPPVMAKLDGTSLKATARAAMLTAALKWLLDKIPILLVPVQFRPAVKMLKQLSPVVGYIGVFIAWSWDRVRACDQGNGVVLTATWLLPVALLPMTWDAGDIYGPRPPPKPEDIAANMEDKTTSESINPADKNTKKEEKKKSLFSW